jgi:hypothetical protein
MAAPKKSRTTAEFGDFQTPERLCRQALAIVRQLDFCPATIMEPSCGIGTFLHAAAEAYPTASVFGLEINDNYLAAARNRLACHSSPTSIVQGNFFTENWNARLASLPSPLLIVGNPPWVTNAALGLLGSKNLPPKSNFQNLQGLDALTGKSNFDISEWMLLKNLEWLREKTGALAVLCKLAVARKVLASAWKHGIPIADARVYRIDALTHFGAAVDACLLVIRINGKSGQAGCYQYPTIESAEPLKQFGFVDHTLISNLHVYNRYRALRGQSRRFIWRSGLKHDCARVMEVERTPLGWKNGLDEILDIEDTHLFPLIKSADICGVRKRRHEKYVIVPQRIVGEDTRSMRERAPLTWDYLNRHREAFERRTSVIYRNKPDFSIFGIGKYSFAPWKIAISGLYKQLTFQLFGDRDGKPVFFDDTIYFLPFDNEEEAQSVLDLLNSEPAKALLDSMVFWEDKRPITAELLKRLDLEKVAEFLFQKIRTPQRTLSDVA